MPLLLLFSLCHVVAISQGLTSHIGAADETGLLQRYAQRFGLLDSLILDGKASSWGIMNPDLPLLREQPAQAGETADSLIDQAVQAQIRAFKAQTGLEFTGQAYVRPDETLGFDSEEELVSAYKAKSQVELRWYYFQSALFRRQGQIEVLRLQGEMDKQARTRDREALVLDIQRQALQAHYDSLHFAVLSQRVANLALLYETQQYLLRTEDISSDQLLLILNEKAQAERLLASLRPPHAEGEPETLPALALWSVTLDCASFLEEVKRQHASLSLLDLQSALTAQQARNTSYLGQVRAAPFVRFSRYDRSLLPASHNLDAGLVFSLPLNGTASRKRKALEAQAQVLRSERAEVEARLTHEVERTAQALAQNDRLMQGEWDRLQALESFLQTRRRAYQNRRGGYSLLTRMKEYNSYLQCYENLLQYLCQRDRLLIDLQAFLGSAPLQAYCDFSLLPPHATDYGRFQFQ